MASPLFDRQVPKIVLQPNPGDHRIRILTQLVEKRLVCHPATDRVCGISSIIPHPLPPLVLLGHHFLEKLGHTSSPEKPLSATGWQNRGSHTFG